MFEFTKRLFTERLLTVTDYGLEFRKIKLQSYPSKSFAFFLQEIAKKKGEDYLFKLGFEAGADY